MIDPDSIAIEENNKNNIITIKEVPEFESEIYCLDDEKEYNKFISDVERNVRRSFEYREFISYLRNNMNMNKCAFLKGVSNEETFDIKIELHHYPFTLHDIVDIVIKKRMYYNDSLSLNMVSKEVMKLHYQLLVGLIPLSETVHELVHNSKLFIPLDKVIGNYNTFIIMYKPFIEPEMLEMIDRMEKYTKEQTSDLLSTNILNENNVKYDIEDKQYQLPDTSNINLNMIEQINRIKENNYILPTINDIKQIEDKKEKKTRNPLLFDSSIMNSSGKYSWE